MSTSSLSESVTRPSGAPKFLPSLGLFLVAGGLFMNATVLPTGFVRYA